MIIELMFSFLFLEKLDILLNMLYSCLICFFSLLSTSSSWTFTIGFWDFGRTFDFFLLIISDKTYFLTLWKIVNHVSFLNLIDWIFNSLLLNRLSRNICLAYWARHRKQRFFIWWHVYTTIKRLRHWIIDHNLFDWRFNLRLIFRW